MKKGFTLLELLVVIAIIAILAAISVPMFRKDEPPFRNEQGQMVERSKLSATDWARKHPNVKIISLFQEYRGRLVIVYEEVPPLPEKP